MTKKEWKPFEDTGREAFLAATNLEKLREEYPNSKHLLENRKLDAQVVRLDRQKAHDLRFKYELLQELDDKPPKKSWLIKNVIAAGETSAWSAPPGGLKSALLAELSFCVASSRDWHSYKSKISGPVVYFALERADLVKRRLLAYVVRSDEDRNEMAHIAIVPGMVDLMNPATVRDVMALIRAIEEDGGEPVCLIIFDTFAKLIAAGGGDENLAKDQGRVFANIQRIKDHTGCHVALIGHTGKDEGRGARGSNALLGDVDVMVTISGEDVKTATVTKANDMPEGPLFSFKSEVHEFGTDPDGDPITVNVVTSADKPSQLATVSEPKLSANQEAMLRLLRDAGPAGLSTADWNARAREIGIGTTRKATLHNIKCQLKDRNLVREYNEVWHAQR